VNLTRVSMAKSDGRKCARMSSRNGRLSKVCLPIFNGKFGELTNVKAKKAGAKQNKNIQRIPGSKKAESVKPKQRMYEQQEESRDVNDAYPSNSTPGGNAGLGKKEISTKSGESRLNKLKAKLFKQ
jgi:hypothetical protein